MGKPVIVRDNSKEDAGQVVKRLRYAHVNFADPIYAKVMLAHADAKEYDGSSEPTVRMPCVKSETSYLAENLHYLGSRLEIEGGQTD
jgi:hypothetical protein